MDNLHLNNRILVTDADNIIAIGVIRSLGKAGYRICATSIFSDALGFKSTYISYSESSPSYKNEKEYCAWLDDIIDRQQISLIIPTTEKFMLAIKPAYDRYKHLLPLSPDSQNVYRVINKYELFKTFDEADPALGLTEHLPPHHLIADTHGAVDFKHLFKKLGCPVYFKANQLNSNNNTGDKVLRVDSETDAASRFSEIQQNYERLLVQGHVAGVGIGAFLLRWNGEIIAHFMHHRLHEVPHTGGISSYRKSTWNSPIYEDALKRLEFLDWQGVAMLEYKWNPGTNEFYLLEINGRFWGSLNLAIKAGVDFPKLIVDSYYNKPIEKQLEFKKDTYCRYTFPVEVQHVLSYIHDNSISKWRRLLCVLEFIALSLDPRVKSDLFWKNDNALYWIQMWRCLSLYGKLAAKKGLRLVTGINPES